MALDESAAARATRQWAYLTVILEEAKIDPKRVPNGQMTFALNAPFERRGLTGADLQAWLAACDPPTDPGWDPVECFRTKVRSALRPQLGLGTALVAIAGTSFLAAFLIARRH